MQFNDFFAFFGQKPQFVIQCDDRKATALFLRKNLPHKLRLAAQFPVKHKHNHPRKRFFFVFKLCPCGKFPFEHGGNLARIRCTRCHIVRIFRSIPCVRQPFDKIPLGGFFFRIEKDHFDFVIAVKCTDLQNESPCVRTDGRTITDHTNDVCIPQRKRNRYG